MAKSLAVRHVIIVFLKAPMPRRKEGCLTNSQVVKRSSKNVLGWFIGTGLYQS